MNREEGARLVGRADKVEGYLVVARMFKRLYTGEGVTERKRSRVTIFF